jgi:hypothetical protein
MGYFCKKIYGLLEGDSNPKQQHGGPRTDRPTKHGIFIFLSLRLRFSPPPSPAASVSESASRLSRSLPPVSVCLTVHLYSRYSLSSGFGSLSLSELPVGCLAIQLKAGRMMAVVSEPRSRASWTGVFFFHQIFPLNSLSSSIRIIFLFLVCNSNKNKSGL